MATPNSAANGIGQLRKVALRGSVAALALISATSAFAQSASSPGAAQVEEVVVTGTSIRGVAPTGSAIIGVSREAVAQAGATNSAEALSTIPALGNFGTTQQGGVSRTSGFAPNIHGLGVDATLTLLNGHRYAPTGSEAIFTDPQIVPALALERVEVIADGASSIYGSDAMAGVVNFVYRKKVEGIEASFEKRYSPAGRNQFGIIGGHDWGSGGAYIAYQYSDRDSARNDEFPFIRSNNVDRGGGDRRSTSCAAPNIRAGTTTYALAGFSTTVNKCDPVGAAEVLPSDKRQLVLINAYQNIGDRVRLTAEINISKYDQQRLITPNPITVVVPRTNPYFQAPPGFTGSEVTVIRTTEGLFPLPPGKGHAETWGFTPGATIDLGGDWKADIMGHVSMSRNTAQNLGGGTFFDIARANILARNTTRDTAFNPFGSAADNNPAVLAQIDPPTGYYNRNFVKNTLKELTVKADGPLFNIPGGAVRAAGGLDFREERTDQLQTTGARNYVPPQQLVPQDVDKSRSSQSAFVELFVPVVGDANAMAAVHALNLSLSGRYDNYEALGGTFNPKIGVVYEPISDLSLRGSYGSSYQAPNLGRSTAPFGFPIVGSNVPGLGTINDYNVGGDNPNLKPQKAKTYSFGFDYQPSYVPGLRLGLSKWDVEIKNLNYQASVNDRFNVFPFNQTTILNPTPAQIAAAIAFAPPAGFVPDRIDAISYNIVQNLGVRQVGGFDLDGAYARTTDYGRFAFTTSALRLTKYRQQVLAGTPYNVLLGTQLGVKWKGRTSLNWGLGPFTANIAMNYTGKYRNNTITPNQNVKAFKTFDLSGTYKLDRFRPNLEFQILALNIFDKDPPFYDSASGYDVANHNPLGREIQFAIRAKF